MSGSRNRWRGRDAMAGIRSSSIVDACLAALVSGVTSCRLIVVNSAGEEVEHILTEWANDEWLASLVRNGALSGNFVSRLSENDRLGVTGLEPWSSARVEIETPRPRPDFDL